MMTETPESTNTPITQETDHLSEESLEASILEAKEQGDILQLSTDLSLLFRTHFDLGQWAAAGSCIDRMKAYLGDEDGFELDEITYFQLQLAVGRAETTCQRKMAVTNAEAFIKTKWSKGEICCLQVDICRALAADGDLETAEARLFEFLENNELEISELLEKGESPLWNGNLRFRVTVLEALSDVTGMRGDAQKARLYKELCAEAEAKCEQAVEEFFNEASERGAKAANREFRLLNSGALIVGFSVGSLISQFLQPGLTLDDVELWAFIVTWGLLAYQFALLKLMQWTGD